MKSIGGSAILMGLFAVVVQAEVPRLIHYQGKLRDASGAAVNDTLELRFRLYNHPSNSMPVLFDETHGSVVVSNGLFNVFIGSASGGVPDSALDAAEVWLGVAVDTGDELAPRSKIGSEAYVIKARSAERLVRPGTFEPAAVVDGAGQVGIGTSFPSSKLDVSGTVTATAFVGDGAGLTGISTGDTDWVEAGGNVYRETGYVGIGTAGPSQLLHLAKSGSDTAMRIETNGVTSGTVTFNFSGIQQAWVVPSGVTSIQVDARGAQGGSGLYQTSTSGTGGKGGRVVTTLTVSPGETLYINVGGKGGTPTGGFNGGALGGTRFNGIGYGGGGGGGSDIRVGGTGLSNRLVVAAGGGGAGTAASSVNHGGAGGGTTGNTGGSSGGGGEGGGGGTPSAGGAGGSSSGASGSSGNGGTGGPGVNFVEIPGGGGGGGYFGGGGGGATGSGGAGGGAGGGGSSYADGAVTSGTTHSPDFQSGHGRITLSYNASPGTDVNWTIGSDHSEYGYLKISHGTALGTNDCVTVDPTGNVTIAGKLNAPGGIDPPYLSFSNESRAKIRNQYAKKLDPHEAVMLFWNAQADRMEIYKVAKDQFYTLDGQLVEEP